MSKRKRPVILGPDGRPYVAPPKAETVEVEPDRPAHRDGGSVIPYSFYDSIFHSGGVTFTLTTGDAKAKKAQPLAEAVADQVGALSADFDGVGGAELPKPEPDLHTYADAYASAVAKCKHPNPESTMYARGEFFCPDCQRYFGPEEYKRTRERGMFGGWFS